MPPPNESPSIFEGTIKKVLKANKGKGHGEILVALRNAFPMDTMTLELRKDWEGEIRRQMGIRVEEKVQTRRRVSVDQVALFS